jgi:hypothetical protein
MRTHFSIHRRRTAHNHIITQCSHNLPIKFKVPHFAFLSHPSRPNSQTQPTPAHSFLRLTGSFCPGTEPGNVVQPVSLLCRAGVVSCCSVCSKSPDVSCCSVRLWWCHGPGIICTSEIGAVDIEDTGDGSTCRGHRGHRRRAYAPWTSRTPGLQAAGLSLPWPMREKGKLLYLRPPLTMGSQTPRLQLARPGTFMASCT